jgi:hypothetical protein
VNFLERLGQCEDSFTGCVTRYTISSDGRLLGEIWHTLQASGYDPAYASTRSGVLEATNLSAISPLTPRKRRVVALCLILLIGKASKFRTNALSMVF